MNLKEKIGWVDENHLPDFNFSLFDNSIIAVVAFVGNGCLIGSLSGQFLKLKYGLAFFVGFDNIGLAFDLKINFNILHGSILVVL